MKKQLVAETIGLSSSQGRLLFLAIVSSVVYVLPIHVLAGFSLWHRLGLPAPSVGLTRAYHYVLHFDFSAAWQQNSLIYLVIAIGLPIILKDVYTMLKLKQGTIRHGRAKQSKPTTTTATPAASTAHHANNTTNS